jgi:hypothetical protein
LASTLSREITRVWEGPRSNFSWSRPLAAFAAIRDSPRAILLPQVSVGADLRTATSGGDGKPDPRRRRFDVLVVWRLDRLGRNLRHLITMLEECAALGIAFVSLNEGIDATTPASKLRMHILGAIAEFERARIAERVKAGMRRAQGGRRPRRPPATARQPACARADVASFGAGGRGPPAPLSRGGSPHASVSKGCLIPSPGSPRQSAVSGRGTVSQNEWFWDREQTSGSSKRRRHQMHRP